MMIQLVWSVKQLGYEFSDPGFESQ